jgi:hypothetical protein
METTKKKSSKKKSTMDEAIENILKRGGKLSALAKHWQATDSSDWEIVDMRAVLR